MLSFVRRMKFLCWVAHDWVDKGICDKTDQESVKLSSPPLKPEIFSSFF